MSVDIRGHILAVYAYFAASMYSTVCATMFNGLENYCLLAAEAQKIPRYHGYFVLRLFGFDLCVTRSLMGAKSSTEGEKFHEWEDISWSRVLIEEDQQWGTMY